MESEILRGYISTVAIKLYILIFGNILSITSEDIKQSLYSLCILKFPSWKRPIQFIYV